MTARFDVHANPDGEGYVVVCQSDVFTPYAVRVVVPLLPITIAPAPVFRLNPVFEIRGASFVMVPHFIAAVPVAMLGPVITSLANDDLAIQASIDMMLSGY